MKPYAIGDRFDLLEEDIHGTITNVLYDEGKPFALVVFMREDEWATVDLSKIYYETVH
jgi:hypothetical protein